MKQFCHNDDGGGGTQGWIETDVACPSGDGDAKVCVGMFVPYIIPYHRFVKETRPSVLGNRDSQADRGCRSSQPS